MLPITDNPLDLTLIFPNALAFLIDDHADNRPAFEYGMGYLLVYKDLMTFMHYMELMKERGEAFPVLYQEAICLFFAAVQKDPEAFRSFPISQEVQNRFLQFMNSLVIPIIITLNLSRLLNDNNTWIIQRKERSSEIL